MIHGFKTGLRAVEREDLPFLAQLANDRTVASHVVGWDFPLSVGDQISWFETASRDLTTKRLVVTDLENQPIGLTGLWNIDWHNRHGLTALKFYPPAVSEKGMGSDSIKTLMAYAFYDVGLNRLWGEILDFNGPSFGAYVKNCGWRIEGILRSHVYRKGRFHDLYRVAILKSEFDALDDASEYVERVLPADTNQRAILEQGWWADTSS